MADRHRIFLDTSAIFAGIWSAEGGARMLLKLGEAQVIQLLVSPQVLAEAEGVVRRKAPESLGLLALLLDQSKVEVVPSPSPEVIDRARTLTGHAGDAVVLAAACVRGSITILVYRRAGPLFLSRQKCLSRPSSLI